MSFNISNNSYNSYLNSNTSFSSSKISSLEAKSADGNDAVKNQSSATITKNGKTYYIVKVDGESYMYDYENDTYTKYSASTSENGTSSTKSATYNASSDSIAVSDSVDKQQQAYSYDSTN